MKTLKEMIAVMQAAEDGKQIQARSVRYDTIWVDVEDPPWDWTRTEYRVKPETKKSVGYKRHLCKNISGDVHVRTTVEGCPCVSGCHVIKWIGNEWQYEEYTDVLIH